MEATSDVELQAILALSRWGGLRTPSEPFALQWRNIDWKRQRITIPAVKTRPREIPLFPELVLPLQSLESRSQPVEPSDFVIALHRKRSGTNLRKQILRLAAQHGIPLWPKLFQNQRSSRQTELEERFPRKTVCEWLGNSEQIADRHYLQVRDEHFERAVADEKT